MDKKDLTGNKDAVAQYYDNNTKRFLRFGKHKDTQNIHQALWADGVTRQEEAVNYANELILNEIKSLTGSDDPAIHILDLGCGVGGSLIYLAKKATPETYFTGITISNIQAQLGQQLVQNISEVGRISMMEGDYLHLPELPPISLAYAIEAFVHAADTQLFFREVSEKLVSGGRLVIIDDFLSDHQTKSEQEKKLLAAFRHGWHAHSLIGVKMAKEMGAKAGLQLAKQIDLTPFLEIGRPRDKVIGLMIRLFGRQMQKSTYYQSLTGGYAKQQCIRKGLVKYKMLVFEKLVS